jgi:hypothetical protein
VIFIETSCAFVDLPFSMPSPVGDRTATATRVPTGWVAGRFTPSITIGVRYRIAGTGGHEGRIEPQGTCWFTDTASTETAIANAAVLRESR